MLVITDSAGYNVTYTYSLEVNQDPPLKVIGVKDVLDVNMPLNLFLFASLGTPPYYYSWYVNGVHVSHSQNYTFDPTNLGNYTIEVTLRDFAGYSITKTFTITVHIDPKIYISIPRNVYDVGETLNVSGNASLGTPPYEVIYHINGTPARGNLTVLTTPGTYVVELSSSIT